MRKVFITGMGSISSLGLTVEEQLKKLRSGQSGIGKVNHFQSVYSESLPFAEINASDEELKAITGFAEKGITRTTLIAIKAFQEAIADSRLTPAQISHTRTAFISSSTVGGMCYTDALYTDANNKGEISEFYSSYEGSNHTLQIVKQFKLKGYTDTINTACSSSANAILLGARLIQSGRADRAIVGGADCLAKFTVNGFNSLRILNEQPCKPFDEHREGLTLGEGAAYLVLEAENVIENKPLYAEVKGFGNANDAFHPSATSDDARGPLKAMRDALSTAGLQPSAIDYINAHGTGTVNNDETESFAFMELFGTAIPAFSSTKGYTGHTLAAAGALEAIISVLSIQNNEIYPNLNFSTPIAGRGLIPVTNLKQGVEIKNVLSNSFGFGGNGTSLIISKVD
ncbi:MAG: beta-ketoacyl-[acyl-carrier-protein] synthase family protein [Crocinitomicaceae bacterium]|nr:beta-ketoacyl-[acyl-carrier-protein] synthase family protein [Crocinitomicaceae bacterium]